MVRLIRMLVLSGLAAIGCRTAHAEEIEPAGLYFHQFTGAATGSEWSTMGSLPTPGRFEFADLPGLGAYPGTLDAEGKFTLDQRLGTGTFRSDGTGSMEFTLGGGRIFTRRSSALRTPMRDSRCSSLRPATATHLSGGHGTRS